MNKNMFIIIVLIASLCGFYYMLVDSEKKISNVENPVASVAPEVEVEQTGCSLSRLKKVKSKFSQYPLSQIPLEQLADNVAIAVGLTGKTKDYNYRMKAVNKLSRKLSRNDILALTAFLKEPLDESLGMTLRGFNAIKNDIMAKLIDQETPIEGLGHFLVELAQSNELNEVCRDYAVQFFPYVYQNRWEAGSAFDNTDSQSTDNFERQSLIDGFSQALTESDTTLAGTALLAVDYLEKDYPEMKELNAHEAAEEILNNPGSCEASKITALLIGSKSDNENVLESARVIAQTGETIPLRLAAVNALANMGTEEDIEVLESFMNDDDKILANAARKAVEKLKQI